MHPFLERNDTMKLPNGFGSVHKLPGNRRNPWRARKTAGWETDFEKGTCKQKYITIGYYPTQKDHYRHWLIIMQTRMTLL